MAANPPPSEQNCPYPNLPASRIVWFVVIAIIGCAADLISKHLVFQSSELYRGSEWWLLQDHIGIQKSLNEGALFGMGQGRTWFFAVFSLIALVAIPVWLFWFRAAQDRWLNLALASVTGGILGNLYDRLGMPGLEWGQFNAARAGERIYAVRDWILLQWNDQWVWPNFNIADMLLVGGAGLLMIHAFLVPQTPTSEQAITKTK